MCSTSAHQACRFHPNADCRCDDSSEPVEKVRHRGVPRFAESTDVVCESVT